MIEKNQYQKVLDTGLILDHYHLLCILRDGGELPKSKRIQGFINLLNKKGYIEDGVLTQDALDLIQEYVSTTTCCTTTSPPIDTDGKFDYKEWAFGLHKRCQERIKELTGKVQVVSRVNGKGRGYSFLCNAADLAKVILKLINLYKIKDLDKVEKCMMQHIDKCSMGKEWFPLMYYYIMKDGVSSLVTDLENLGEDDSTDFKSSQKFV